MFVSWKWKNYRTFVIYKVMRDDDDKRCGKPRDESWVYLNSLIFYEK